MNEKKKYQVCIDVENGLFSIMNRIFYSFAITKMLEILYNSFGFQFDGVNILFYYAFTFIYC